MKKSLVRYISLGIVSLMGVGGLLSLSSLFDTGSSNQFINEKDNDNTLLGTSVNNHQFININSINTEGTKLPSSGGTLSSGTYYLDSDMTLSNYITAASGRNIIINLNGFSLSAKPNSNQPIVYVKGGTLTINGKDDESGNMGTLCNGTGYYDGSYTRGGAVAIYADGTNMGNATINDCNIANNTAAFAGAIFISKGSTATLNNCNVYNNDSTSDPSYGYRGALYVENVGSTLNINGGEIYGNEGGVLLWGNNSQSSSANLNGVYVHDNAKFGVRLHGSDNGNAPLTIAGDTIIKNNPSASSTEQANLRLNGSNRGKFTFPSGLGDNAYIGITMQGTYGVFTSGWSQYMGDADFSDYFFSDSTAVIIGKNPSGELLLGAPRTVTYNTEHGTAPASDTVANGSIILNEPTSPSEAGYEFQGWYKESTFENAWNFETDAVTADTTLYAKMEYIDPAVANVIKLINDIDPVTYDGGTNDSKADIEAARAAYDALDDTLKPYVSNYQTLVDDEKLYNHVNNVATMIEGIPEASESDEYYNAVDAANAAFNELTDAEKAIIRAATNVNYEKVLNDNVAAKNVIKKIQDIGSLTYDGGTNDSKAAIEAAENAYNALSADQKAIVNGVNHNTLVNDRTIYDHVDNVAILINAIPEANESDEYYNAVDTAKAAYDKLTGVEQALLGDAPNFDYVKKLNDNVAAKKVIKLIDDINEITYNGGKDDSLADIINAEKEYYGLTDDQKAIVNGVNKGTLDHDRLVYDHVDYVGDLIKEIPEASNTDDYYNAVDAAKAAYDDLTGEEKAILGDAIDFSYKKVLEDNIKAEEVIKLIDEIGEVTYNGGSNDSLEDIENAEDAYNALNADQKALVELANLDTLEEDRETYDAVDETVKLIESIGDVSHGGEDDSKEAIDAAKAAFDSLTPEQQALVASYNNSEKVLEDDEAVYGAMEAIDSIGDVSYTTESEEAIKHAQEVYDSLTEDQKEQLGDAYRNVLIEAGNKYETVSKQGDILFLILIIVTSLTLVGGIWFLFFLIKKKRKNNDDQGGDNSKGKPVKAYSFGGLLTFPILVSHYFDAKYITLYVLAALAIVIWIVCLIVALTIKRKKAVKEEVKPQQVKETTLQENNEDEEEVETITDEKGNTFQIRFIKSFTAKLIQSPEETKKYYEELKNEVLSYKGTHSRISWHFDSANAGRNYVLKFAVRGKTLCVYFPLNADDYADSKYKVEKAESKRYEDVPCLYRIKNDRRLGYAKELIAMVASNLGLEKGEEQHEVYSNLPYEPNKPLVARGLIKEQKVQVNKPAEQQVLETKVNRDGDEIVVTKDEKGNIFEIRYIKSFTAKLIQSPEETKKYYEELKNEVLSYKKTNSRISWHFDSVNSGRNYVLKFAVRGKTLCAYFPLNADDYADSKYKVEKVESKKYEDTPCLYRIKNDRRCAYAKELIGVVANKLGLEKGEEQHEVYSNLPYEENKPLIARGLIKELKVQVNKPAEGPIVLESKVNSEGDEVVLTKDSNGNLFEIRYIKSFTAKLSQSEAEVKDYYTILKNYVLSYRGVHSRVSWHYDAINVGRDYVLKFAIRGKTLCAYFALDASKLDSKYKVEEAKGNRYIDVPCLYRIKNDRRCQYAKELIDLLMKEHGLNQGEIPNEDYRIKKESTKALLDKGLIKEVKSKIQDKKVIEHYESITVSKADEVMSDKKAESYIEEVEVNKHKEGSKEIINIDTLSKYYNNGDEVTLDSLIEKGLVPSKVGHIKVLARGELDKKLHVVANEYSLQAIKMIVLMGGTVKKIK